MIKTEQTASSLFVTQRGKIKNGIQYDEEVVQMRNDEKVEAQESLSTLLVRKNQEASLLHDILKSSRDTYAFRMKRFDEREQELEVKVKDLLLNHRNKHWKHKSNSSRNSRKTMS